ncbi:MAG: type II toxin-antitoxin system VapC family toxin [Pseudohongiellaceae bacterium]
MSWLLDTCALSEYTKKVPSPKVISWLDDQDEASLFISVISLGEIEKGILKLRAIDPRRSQKLTAWLGKLEQRFAGRILPLDTAALHVWAQIAAYSELSGQPLPVMDSLLMAIAQCHGLTIVTRNEQDFAPYPQTFNPWSL